MLKIKIPSKPVAVKKAAATKVAAKPRSRYDEDEDDDAKPIRPSKAEREVANHAATKGGWGHGDSQKESSFENRFTKNLSIKDGETAVFKFLEDAPFAAVKVHWVDKKGQRSYLCPETEDCPLCAADIKVDFEARFNVAVLTEAEPVLRSFVAKSRRYEEVKLYNKPPTGPLTKKWYSYSRTGTKMQDTRYKFDLIRRSSDIEEDFPDLRVPTSEEMEALELYTAEEVDAERPTMKDLREVAADVLGGGYDDD